jgi:hypothetical protein
VRGAVFDPANNGHNEIGLDESGKYTITITYDPLTSDWQCKGLNIPAWISLGMLKYMEVQVRRRDAEIAMAEAAANAPRIALPGSVQ